MLEETATESIVEARNVYIYEEFDRSYDNTIRIDQKAKCALVNVINKVLF